MFSVDQIVWCNGRKRPPKTDCDRMLRELACRPRWATDGVSSVLEAAADPVIFLYVPAVCTGRCALRNLPYLWRSRPALAASCPQWKIVPVLVRIIWRFGRNVRPANLKRARRAHSGQAYCRITGRADQQKVLKRLGVSLDAEKAHAVHQ